MDLVYLAAIGLFLSLAMALAYGCHRLGGGQ